MLLKGNSFSYATKTALRIAGTAWLLSMIVVIYAYSGVLTSLLAVQKLEPTVDTLDQLVAGGKFQLTMEKNSQLTNIVLVNYSLYLFKIIYYY